MAEENRDGLALGDDSGGSLGECGHYLLLQRWTSFSDSVEYPIILLGDDDSGAFEVDYGSCAKGTESDVGLFGNLENAVDSTTPVRTALMTSPSRLYACGLQNKEVRRQISYALIPPFVPLERAIARQ